MECTPTHAVTNKGKHEWQNNQKKKDKKFRTMDKVCKLYLLSRIFSSPNECVFSLKTVAKEENRER